MSSRSCDSVYRSHKSKINPKPPVEQSTTRILERAQDEQTYENGSNKRNEAVTQQ